MAKEKNTETKRNSLLPLIILAVICGMIAGVVGELVFRTYIFPDYSTSYFNSEFNLADLNNNRSNLVIRDAKKVVVNQDVKVEETINSVQPSLLRVYRKIETATEVDSGAATSSIEAIDLSQDISYYRLDEPLFIALAITSDGWAVASLSDEMLQDFDVSQYVAIDNNRKVYNLDEISDFNNLPGNVVFFHVENISNMSIKAVAKRSDLSLGQSVVTISDFDSVYLTSVSAIKYPSGLLNSDNLNVRLDLAGDLSNDFLNSFVFNLAGDLVAIVGPQKELIPAFSYAHYWQSFFSDKSFSAPYFGANYLDLSRTKVIGLDRDKGALLQSEAETLAVELNSPAQSAGLQLGDIITWVNNNEINYINDLSSVISSFKPGDEVSIIYLRNGKEETVKVKLGVKK